MNESPTAAQAPGAEITPERPVLALGAGPAGLTAGYLLARQGKPVIVLESSDQVGGIARTDVREGYRFDLGGHRFFTKVREVDDLWHEILAGEFLKRPRQSRIYWNHKFLEYPLQGMDVIRKLGPVDLTKALFSYLWAAIKPKGREDTFEEWVCNRFGRWLFNQFFKSYTEKVWGVSRDEIRANGGEVRLNAPVTRLRMDGAAVVEVVAGGETLTPSHVISSLPLRTTVGIADPEAPVDVRDAALGLRYRDFLTVLLVIEDEDMFPDNWIYIHDPTVQVGRIQNFRSWSPWMVPSKTDASIGMEYFCFEGDELWSKSDEELVAMATREIQQLGLARADKVKFGFVVRVSKAYPMYDVEYAERVSTIREWLDGIPNLIQV